MTQSQTPAGFGKTDALLLLMALIWGVNFSVVKYGTVVMSPLAFTGLRVMLAALVLLTYALAREAKLPTRREILTLMTLGILGNGLYQIFFIEGISRTNVGNAALIVAATPALIAIISRVRGVDRVNPRVLGGIALSLSGVVLVVVTVSVDEVVAGFGVNVAVVLPGRPLTESVTGLLNPFNAAMSTL